MAAGTETEKGEKKPRIDYTTMDRAGIIASVTNTITESRGSRTNAQGERERLPSFVLRVSKSELAQAIGQLRGTEPVVSETAKPKQGVVSTLVNFVDAVAQNQYTSEKKDGRYVNSPVLKDGVQQQDKGIAGLEALANDFGTQPTRRLMFDPALMIDKLNSLRSKDKALAVAEPFREAVVESISRETAVQKNKTAARENAKAKGGEGIAA